MYIATESDHTESAQYPSITGDPTTWTPVDQFLLNIAIFHPEVEQVQVVVNSSKANG